MRSKIVILVLTASVAFVRADQTIQNVQQTLKDQGFYYGEITGEKNADTVAAIRRYQIRNGLQVTGELNDETLRSLRGTSSSSQSPAMQAQSRNEQKTELRDQSSRESTENRLVPAQPFVAPPPDRQSVQPNSAASPAGGLFAGTPYEHAPTSEQRNVIVSAQIALARRGLYRSEVDGTYGPALEFSVRAYQSRVGLPVTGRLDLETLAALELLPGARSSIYAPRRRIWQEPPVRGEWVRP
jgi:peptidoglycan hydrolase-like protein with peptidoglycan-binding domain